MDAAEKIVCLEAAGYNEYFENCVVRGFSDPLVKRRRG